MTRRTHAIAVFLVMLLVVAVCGISFAAGTDVATNLCGAGSGWAAAKVDAPASAKPLLGLPAIPAALLDVSDPAAPWAAVEDDTRAASRVILGQPRGPRAPPLA